MSNDKKESQNNERKERVVKIWQKWWEKNLYEIWLNWCFTYDSGSGARRENSRTLGAGRGWSSLHSSHVQLWIHCTCLHRRCEINTWSQIFGANILPLQRNGVAQATCTNQTICLKNNSEGKWRHLEKDRMEEIYD